MDTRISVIIPNYNGGRTIGQCLEAVFASDFSRFEVIVVDDCSDDGSVGIISRFPCRLIKLGRRSGASKARNEGARQSRGEILFFIDADCLMMPHTLSVVDATITGSEKTVYGGTYTLLPHDTDFFSRFQSVFINYSETRKAEPDYIASHAMVIERGLFLEHNGFPEVFLPIIEDVEFSHRLRGAGVRLLMNPEIQVRHIFHFTFRRSMRNAFRKSLYWTIYSMQSRGMTSDSGTASVELKLNVLAWFVAVCLLLFFAVTGSRIYAAAAGLLLLLNLSASRKFLKAMLRASGIGFASAGAAYYSLVYPAAVAAGGLSGLLRYYISHREG